MTQTVCRAFVDDEAFTTDVNVAVCVCRLGQRGAHDTNTVARIEVSEPGIGEIEIHFDRYGSGAPLGIRAAATTPG